jgi:hypothetical protein
MANLSNINNKFLVTTGGEVLVGRTAATGTSKLQVSGSLLIGTDISSGIPLVVQETTANGFAIGFMRNTNTTNGNGLVIDVNSTGGAYIQDWRQASTVKMRLLQNGNLGIGTDLPNQLLELSKNGSPVMRLNSSKTTNGAIGDSIGRIEWRGSNNAGNGAGIKAAIDTSATSTTQRDFDILFKTGNNIGSGEPPTRMRIDADGNVGIGAITPLTTLHVNQANDAQVLVQGANKMALHQDAAWSSNILLGCYYDGSNIVYGSTNRGAFKIVGLHDSTTQPQTLSIYGANGAAPAGSTVTFNSVGFSQDEDGNIGIGTTGPGAKLDVQSSTTGNLLARVYNPNTGTSSSAAFRIASSANNANSASLQFSDASAYTATISGDRVQGLVFRTSASGSNPITIPERMSINSDGLVTLASMSSNDTRQLTFMGDSNSTSGNGGAIGMFANETRLTSNWYYNSGQQKYVAGNGQAVIGLSTGTTDATSFIGFGVNGPADSAGPTLRMKITSAGVVKVENTAAAHLILNGDTNNTGDTGQVDSIIDLLGDGNPGIYGYRINTENWSGQTALNFQEYLNGSYTSRLFISKDGNVGIGATSSLNKLQVNGDIGIGEINSTRSTNVRFAKNDVNVITFDISVAAIGAWRPGSCWIQVSGTQNGLQEYWSAWYFIRLTHYYASGVAGQGSTNPSCILDSGGDTSRVVVGVSSTNSSDPQIITITLTDVGGSTNSMVADINCTMQVGINSIT